MFFVAMAPCPEDPLERAEELYLGRLATTAAESFERHLEGCACCRQVYEETATFIRSTRAAAKSWRSQTSAGSN